MEYLHEKYTHEELLSIQAELFEIRDGYVPTMPWDPPEADLMYITYNYVSQPGKDLLDGVHVEYIMNYNIEEVVEEVPEEGVE